MNIVAERLRTRLKLLGLTPRAASLRAKRQPFVVRDILAGRNENPKSDLILDLARALVCSTDYLLGLSDSPGGDPGNLDIDPKLLGALQQIPLSEQRTVRRMLEGVADAARAEFDADSRLKSKKPRKRAAKKKP